MKRNIIIFLTILLLQSNFVFASEANFINQTKNSIELDFDKSHKEEIGYEEPYNNRYYYESAIVGREYLGKKIVSTRELHSSSEFNSGISDFLTIAGAFSKVATVAGYIYIPANLAYQDWKKTFSLPDPGFIEFTRYTKVRYRVDRLTKKRYIESSILYIEAEKYLYLYPEGGHWYIGTKVWSSRIK